MPSSPTAGRVLVAIAQSPLNPAPTWTRYDDITLELCGGWDIDTGRQSELDTTDTGTANVYFNARNNTTFDVNLVGMQIMLQAYDPVAAAWQPQYRGVIDDVQVVPNPLVDSANDLSAVQWTCVDRFDYLGGVKFLPGVHGNTAPAGMSGVAFYEDGPVNTRLEALLDDANVDPDDYVVFEGNVEVNETLYGTEEVILQGLRDAADAEFPGIANVYVDRFGRVVFHGRFARFDPDGTAGPAGADAWDFQRWSAATREDVTTGVAQIREFAYNFPRSRIINSYVAWPREDENGVPWNHAGISTQISTDATSITTYGYHGDDSPDLIIKRLKPAVGTSTGAQQCKLFADFYVNNYAVPRLNVQRVKFMSVMPDDPVAAATWALMTRADISDIIALTIDEAGLTAEDFYIEGFHKELRPANNTVDMLTVTPNLTPFAYYTDNVFAP